MDISCAFLDGHVNSISRWWIFQSLRNKIDEETRVNTEIESYLRNHQSDLEQKVEYWMEKYDKDVEAKQHELDVLIASKAKDLEKLQDLTRTVSVYGYFK